jgi:hypothetical protein
MGELKKQHMSDQPGKPVSEVDAGSPNEATLGTSIIMNDPTLMYDEDLGKFAKQLASDMDKHVENADNEAKEYNRKMATNWPVFLEIRNRLDNHGYRTDLIKEGSDTDAKRKRTKDDLIRSFGATFHKEWVQKNFPWSVQYHNRKLKALLEAAECTQKLIEAGSGQTRSGVGAQKTGNGGAAATQEPAMSREIRKGDFNRYKHVAHVAYEEAKKYQGHPLARIINAAVLQHKFEPVSGTWIRPATAVDSEIAKLAVEMSEIVNGQLGDKLIGSKTGQRLLSIAKEVLAIKCRRTARLTKESHTLSPLPDAAPADVNTSSTEWAAIQTDQEQEPQIAA